MPIPPAAFALVRLHSRLFGAMPRGLGQRLRFLLGQFRQDFDPFASDYPAIREGLAVLEEAVAEGFPAKSGPKKRRGAPKQLASDKLAACKRKLRWVRACRKKAEASLGNIKRGKKKGNNKLTPAFLTKVALSWPSTSARSFATAWRDLIGVGAVGVCRSTISRIKDAFAEVVKGISFERARLAGATAARAGTAAFAPDGNGVLPLNCCALLHIHDEASLRLRSHTEADQGAPSKGRGSKVMQHSATLHFDGQPPVRWLTELDPLADKTAATLATSLWGVLRPIGQVVGDIFARRAAAQRPWLVHIVVADGLEANTAAAKVVLAWAQRDPFPNALRYLLICVKCASHQANLVTGNAVVGPAALLGGRSSVLPSTVSGFAERNVCGAVVRLFKYLMTDFAADFAANLHDWVGRFSACAPSEERGLQVEEWRKLEQLYGPGVFPPTLLHFLKCGLGEWSHCLEWSASAASAPDPARRMEDIRDGLLQLLRKRLLVVDEHPTLSRMFTFVKHLQCLLLMHFMGSFDILVKLRGSQPREKSSKRVQKVHAFLKSADTPQYLRRTVLCLQLTDHATAVCSQLCDKGEPLLVRLSKGAVQKKACIDLGRVLGELHLDSLLDAGACVSSLLATFAEIVLRYRVYSAWPYLAWQLTKRFNEDSFIGACLDFLQMDGELLDTGFGLPLLEMARRAGDTAVERLAWLVSEPVQNALVLAFEASAASSLPIERAFAETKRSEAPRLCHVATAGRNLILRQFLRERQDLLDQAERASAALRRSAALNLQSLAWEVRPDLADRHRDTSSDLRQFIQENERWMKAEIERRRERAHAAVERVSAQGALVTEATWTEWFEENEEAFRVKMQEGSRQRREKNHRLHAAPDHPPPVSRLTAVTSRQKVRNMARWLQLAWGRAGWFSVSLPGREVRLLFLFSFGGRTYCVDLSGFRTGKRHILDTNACRWIVDNFVPLEELDVRQVVQLCECRVSAAPAPGRVSLKVELAWPVEEPLPRKRRSRKRKLSPETVPEVISSSDSDSDVLAKVPTISSDESSACSVDTDGDSGLDDLCGAARPESGDCDAAAASDMEEEGDAVGLADDAAAEVAAVGSLAPVAAVERAKRHPAGTWTIWECCWFYITKTPNYSDIKCHVRAPLRNAHGGLGTKFLSRTLTPRHYDDEWVNPTKTVLLLRAWTVWRAQQDGWSTVKACRATELLRQRERLKADLAAAHGALVSRPLLQSTAADAHLSKWVPDIVAELMAGR